MSLTTCQQSAFDFIASMKSGETVFLTGQAGTGKSYLMEHLQIQLENCLTVASTGMAAAQIGGATCHSTFGLEIGIYEPFNKPFRVTKENKEAIEAADYLLIDEVSMVRADTLDSISDCCKWVREDKRRFGGLKVIMVGDILQLPPIVSRDEAEEFAQLYRSPWFFDAMCLTADLQVSELKTVMRQKELTFLEALNAAREGRADGVDLLNTRVAPKPAGAIELVTRNAKAESRNMQELQKLDGKTFWFYGELVGKFKESECPVPMTLTLKKGARVVLMKNSREYRNGQMGTVMGCEEEIVSVLLDDGETVAVGPATWEKSTYSRGEDGKLAREIVGTYRQVPLRLGYAVSVHKSQGQTYEQVHLNIAGQCFQPGMAYVAISRCKALGGITLEKPLRPSDIFADQTVGQFYRNANWVGGDR